VALPEEATLKARIETFGAGLKRRRFRWDFLQHGSP
jgi:hypothetical protein